MVFHSKTKYFSDTVPCEHQGILVEISNTIIHVKMPNIADITTKSNNDYQRVKFVKMVGAYYDMPVQYYWDTTDYVLFKMVEVLIGKEMIFVFDFHHHSSGYATQSIDLQDFLKSPAA